MSDTAPSSKRERTLSTGSDDSLPSTPGEPEGGDGHLGDNKESLIVGNGSDKDDGLGTVLVGVVSVLDDSGDGKGRSVGLGLEESLEDNLVELGVSSSSKEAVKLVEGRLDRTSGGEACLETGVCV